MLVKSWFLDEISEFFFDGFLYGKSYETACEYVREGAKDKGKEFIVHLNGQFSYFFKDAEVGLFHVFNDRFGVNDCFFYQEGERWVIGADFNELVKSTFQESVNDIAFVESVMFGHPLFENTIY